MLMADALAVWAEEGRVLERDINGEPLNRRYQPLVSEWGNPALCKQDDQVPCGTWGEPGELKHLSTRRKRNQ